MKKHLSVLGMWHRMDDEIQHAEAAQRLEREGVLQGITTILQSISGFSVVLERLEQARLRQL